MGNTLTILKRELGSYFNSPIAYIVVTVFLLLGGFLFFQQVFLVGEASMRSYFSLMPLILILTVPPTTMHLLAEEKRSGTIELLVTMPVTDWQVVLGKYFAALAVMTIAILITLVYPITLNSYGDIDWGAVTSGYIGLVLFAGAYIAIGLMTSSWTKDQIIALLLAMLITFAFWLLGEMLQLLPTGVASIVEYATTGSHLQSFSKGVVDSRDVVYFLSLIGACLFMATQSLDSRRWR